MGAAAFTDGRCTASVQVSGSDGNQTYTLKTTAPLRDNVPADKTRTFSERPDGPQVRSGSDLFDALYAMALDDARLNAVDQIRDGSFEVRESMNRPYFQTGEKWTYVWTRDISYSVDLGLASLDPLRSMNSLLFKTTRLKPGLPGEYARQVVQDTGSGGSYPVSTDRAVWAFGAEELLKYLDGSERERFVDDAWQILHDTIEHDRRLIFDPADGLYRGEQSFLDWREQTYPGWTRDNVLAIACSKTLSTNIGHFQMLKTAAELARRKGLAESQKRYAEWAQALRTAINREFYLEDEGLYSSIILDDPVKIRLHRFDLLGQSLAILCGVADRPQGERIIARYPQAEHGPPVVWPQEQTVPIYHNQAIWPFVTAYWLRAARQVGNPAAVDHAVHSLVRGAALNLSNMENFDWVTGMAWAEVNGISGPVINSQRQLWSVAGYLSMVQDVVFGLETDRDAIRFLPCVTPGIHRDYLNGGRTLTLKHFSYRGRAITVTVGLPEPAGDRGGIYRVDKIVLNGRTISRDFVPFQELQEQNEWHIELAAAGEEEPGSIRLIKDLGRRRIFGPAQPRWKEIGQGGITAENGRLTLHYESDGEAGLRFNIYRNGRICAEEIAGTQWTDPDASDYPDRLYCYSIEAVYPESGNRSHMSPVRFYCPAEKRIEIGAASMKNSGGNLVDNHHFENWGRREHELLIPAFRVNESGTYLIRAEYSNGAGPINTGVTCAVKRIDILETGAPQPAASAYLVMPHTADWTRYLESSSFRAELKAGRVYSIRICEDEAARNMSYFDHYEPYKGTGSGNDPYNYVNIAKIKLIPVD